MLRSKHKKIAVILAAVLFLYALVACLPRPRAYESENPLLANGKPLAFAHRGGAEEFPENTLEAYYHAVQLYPDMVLETDVRLTKDGVLILLHDDTLDSTCNRQGSVADITYGELLEERVDFGYDNDTENGNLVGELHRFQSDKGVFVTPLDVVYPEGVTPRDREAFLVTRFDELLTAFPNNFISVEIKDEERGVEALHALVDVLREHDAFDRVLVASFLGDVTRECRRLVRTGEAPQNFMYTVSLTSSVWFIALSTLGLDALYFTEGAAMHLPVEELGFRLATPRLIRAAHRHNIAVHYFTIDERAEMEALVAMGADGIMSDLPGVFIDALYGIT